MVIQQLRKAIHVAALQFKPHQRRHLLDLLQCKHTVRLIAGIPSDHVTEQVSCQPALTGVDQAETLVQFLLCFLRDFHMYYLQLLVNPRHGSDVLQPLCDTAHLILPAASGGHDLLHGQYMGIQVFLCISDPHELKHRLHTGSGKD